MKMYAILRNDNYVKHLIMEGSNLNYKKAVVYDLVFNSERKAKEVSKVLQGKTKVVVYEEYEIEKAA